MTANLISPSLAELTYQRITKWMRDAGLPAGARLPGEHALAATFSVSRPVLRQVLTRLRAENKVYARKGSGTFVYGDANAPPIMVFEPLANIPDVRRFLEFRCSVECEMAAEAARHRTAADICAIHAARDKLEQDIAGGHPGIEADIDLHMAFARASGNRFYVAVLQAVSEQTRFSIRLTRELATRPAVDRAREIRSEHEQLCDAIRSGDSNDARRAMDAHLKGGIARLFVSEPIP